MQLKVLAALLAVLIETTSARRCRSPISPPSPPNTLLVIQEAPERYSCAPKCTRQFEELILPPMRAELPQGLGYFPAAAPLVASCYNPGLEVESVPVTSPCRCLTLASPVCPDWAPLVRPIIL